MTTNLTRRAISDAVSADGWRLNLGGLDTLIAVSSLGAGGRLIAQIIERGVPADEGAIRFDLRPGAVLITIEPMDRPLDQRDLELARAISAAVADLEAETVSELADRSLAAQRVEFAIDAMDVDAVRPFWRAVLGYFDSPDGSLYDPGHRGFPVWFQQMDAPRTQRNRVHFDVVVGHDQAPSRIATTLAAGGRIVSDARAPAFWVLADVEGNEVCICTWQGRDADALAADGAADGAGAVDGAAGSDPGVTL